MAKVTVNGVSIHYQSIGEGRDVVLIHGLGANQAFWVPAILFPLAREYRVTVFDLRGHGYSGMPREGYTSADMASDLRHLLDHLNIQKADLVGHSFGGVVALHSAVLFPERVKSLCLADTRVRAFQPTQSPRDWVHSEKVLSKLSERGFTIADDETEVGLWLLEKLASPEWRDKRQKLEEDGVFIPFSSRNGGGRSAERWMRLLNDTTAREDLTSLAGLTKDRLSEIQQPVLAICCEYSTAMRSLEAMKRHLYQCQTAMIPGTGHFFPLTHPDLFVGKVREFIERAKASERRKHARIAFRIPVGVLVKGRGSILGTTVNVSNSGLLIEALGELAPGVEVEVIPRLERKAGQIGLRGTIVRSFMEKDPLRQHIGVALEPNGPGQRYWEAFLAE